MENFMIFVKVSRIDFRFDVKFKYIYWNWNDGRFYELVVHEQFIVESGRKSILKFIWLFFLRKYNKLL